MLIESPILSEQVKKNINMQEIKMSRMKFVSGRMQYAPTSEFYFDPFLPCSFAPQLTIANSQLTRLRYLSDLQPIKTPRAHPQ